MSRSTSGTYTLPITGNPVVSGTTVSSTWANATLSDLATEMTSSLDRSGRGPMLQPLQVQDGAVGAPSYTFQNETDSGLYRAGSKNFVFAVNGVAVARFQDTKTTIATLEAGTATVDGNVTMAGSNPASTTAFSNVVTKANVPKAWATIKTDGAGGVSALGGFNVASVAINAGNASVRVTFAQAFANANYAPMAFPGFLVLPVCVGLSGSANKTTTTCDIALRAITVAGAGTLSNLNSTIYEFYVAFFGLQ